MKGRMVGLVLVAACIILCTFSVTQLMSVLFDIGRVAVQVGLQAV